MNIAVYLQEFEADWRLLGRASATADIYCLYVRDLVGDADPASITLPAVKLWLAAAPSAETARYRARAVRAFGRWSAVNDGPAWPWAATVPLAATPPMRATTASASTGSARLTTIAPAAR